MTEYSGRDAWTLLNRGGPIEENAGSVAVNSYEEETDTEGVIEVKTGGHLHKT